MSVRLQVDGGKGDLAGDSTQNGGCIVVTDRGKNVPLVYREQNAAIHVSNQDVIRALKINQPFTKEPSN